MTPLKIFFLGSCVSRDMARIVNIEDRFEVGPYVARQSWISGMSESTPAPTEMTALTSPFQQRMVEADLASSLTSRLIDDTSDIDILLIDLIDERYGVVPTSNGYVTNSYELRNSKWKKILASGDLIEFGSDQHFELWSSAASELLSLLDGIGLSSKACFIDTQYAVSIDTGEPIVGKAIPPEVRNEQFNRYYDRLRDSQLHRIAMPSHLTVADSRHAWGVEPFHYIPQFYAHMADEVERFAWASRVDH